MIDGTRVKVHADTLAAIGERLRSVQTEGELSSLAGRLRATADVLDILACGSAGAAVADAREKAARASLGLKVSYEGVRTAEEAQERFAAAQRGASSA